MLNSLILMRIAQISDLHFTKLSWNPFHLFPKRIFGQLHWLLGRKTKFDLSWLNDLPSFLSQLNVDWVFLGGDFTSSSLPQEFELAQKFTNQLQSPWIAVPGNHDMYTRSSQQTKRYYQYLTNRPPSIFSLAKEGIAAYQIDPLWWVIALDTAQPTAASSSQGFFSQEQEEVLENFLTTLPLNQRVILLNHYPFFQNGPLKHRLNRGKELQNLIERHSQIALYLHGHTHSRIVADLQKGNLPIILDGGSVSDKKSASWNLIDLEEKRCFVTCYEGISPIRKEEFLWTR